MISTDGQRHHSRVPLRSQRRLRASFSCAHSAGSWHVLAPLDVQTASHSRALSTASTAGNLSRRTPASKSMAWRRPLSERAWRITTSSASGSDPISGSLSCLPESLTGARNNHEIRAEAYGSRTHPRPRESDRATVLKTAEPTGTRTPPGATATTATVPRHRVWRQYLSRGLAGGSYPNLSYAYSQLRMILTVT